MNIDLRFWLPQTTRRVEHLVRQLGEVSSARLAGVEQRMDLLLNALSSEDTSYVRYYAEDLERFLVAAAGSVAMMPHVQALLEPIAAQPTSKIMILPGSASPGAEVSALRTLPGAKADGDSYSISSSTLAYAHGCLTRHLPGVGAEPEWMLAVTGLRQDHVRTLEQLIDIRLATQSPGQASFDMSDFTRVAVTLQEHGQALHAIFHSHRFRGAPSPSGTDRRLQGILEDGGYPAIQAVFSEDGYVRFFSNARNFAVAIHGKGVETIEQRSHLYRIVHFDALPYPAHPGNGR